MSKLQKRQMLSVKFRDIRYISNILTTLRIVLVLPIIYFIILKRVKLALVIAVVAMFSDSFDGYLARKLNQVSDLGKILDPIADKLLISGIFISLIVSKSPYLPPYAIWAIAFIIFRDVLVLIGNSYLMLHAQTIISSSGLSKAATDFTYLTIGSYILEKFLFFKYFLKFLKIPFLSLAMIFSAVSAVSYGMEMRSILKEKSVGNE